MINKILTILVLVNIGTAIANFTSYQRSKHYWTRSGCYDGAVKIIQNLDLHVYGDNMEAFDKALDVSLKACDKE